jgi:3-methyladenine DNA glycosylase AlkD
MPAPNAKQLAQQFRDVLRQRGSLPLAESAQRYFKDEVKSRGWRVGDLRRFAHGKRKELLAAGGSSLLVSIADSLFQGPVIEEKCVAVFLLEQSVAKLGEAEFRLFVGWLSRLNNWADHDALVMYLISPMVEQEPARAAQALRWAGNKGIWHRRAAAVCLIRGLRRGLFWDEAGQVAEKLRGDENDLVQKGLGWMLREGGKADARRALPLLMSLRGRTSRLVLRTACEKLTPAQRARVLA